MPTHSSILAWGISWTEEPGRLQSMGLQHVRHDGARPQKACGSHPWAAQRWAPGCRCPRPGGTVNGHLCPVTTTSFSLSPMRATAPHTPEEGLRVTVCSAGGRRSLSDSFRMFTRTKGEDKRPQIPGSPLWEAAGVSVQVHFHLGSTVQKLICWKRNVHVCWFSYSFIAFYFYFISTYGILFLQVLFNGDITLQLDNQYMYFT